MGLTDKLKQVVDSARKLRQSRDPESYARYERNRDLARKRADHERHDREDSADHARAKAERTHDFEDRYAAEHEQHGERDPRQRPESS
jgi:hypothetical protein